MPVQVAVFSFTFMCLLPNAYFTPKVAIVQEQTTTTAKTDLKTLHYGIWCKFQANSFDCTSRGGVQRFYFDLKMQDCKPFRYGFCPSSYNNFDTLNMCWENCRDDGIAKIPLNLSDNVACRLQPDFGHCHDYFPMWYFDINARVCKGFSYSGCGGNQNRFPSEQICTATCPKKTDF